MTGTTNLRNNNSEKLLLIVFVLSLVARLELPVGFTQIKLVSSK